MPLIMPTLLRSKERHPRTIDRPPSFVLLTGARLAAATRSAQLTPARHLLPSAYEHFATKPRQRGVAFADASSKVSHQLL